MILYKKIPAEEVLYAIAHLIAKELPDADNIDINLEFTDEHDVEIHLLNLPEKKQQAPNLQ